MNWSISEAFLLPFFEGHKKAPRRTRSRAEIVKKRWRRRCRSLSFFCCFEIRSIHYDLPPLSPFISGFIYRFSLYGGKFSVSLQWQWRKGRSTAKGERERSERGGEKKVLFPPCTSRSGAREEASEWNYDCFSFCIYREMNGPEKKGGRRRERRNMYADPCRTRYSLKAGLGTTQ